MKPYNQSTMNRIFKFAFSHLNGVKVYALVGRSGTGKSHHSKLVAQKPEGKAQATFDNGDVYNGEWHKGLREGYGEIKYANGDEYKGEWKADKRTGKGYYFKGPYDYVKGDFVDGKPHGLAIRYVNGVRVYNGRWVEGVPQKTGIRANARGKSE